MNAFPRHRAAVALLVFLAGVMAKSEGGEALRIVGSDGLGAGFVGEASEAFEPAGVRVTFALAGSRDAQRRLATGEAEVALVLTREEEQLDASRFRSATLGYFTVIVAVPGDVPLKELDYSKLRSVFGAGGGAARWADVGVAGEAGTRAILPFSMRRELMLGLFRERVLGGGGWDATVKFGDENETVEALRGSGAIALLPAGVALPEGCRVLAIAARADDVAFGPTAENVHAGDYALRVPLRLVIRREMPAAEAVRVAGVFFSERIADSLRRAQLVAVPASVRAAAVRRFEEP